MIHIVIIHITGSQKRRRPQRAGHDMVCIRDDRHPLCRLRPSFCAQVLLLRKETLGALRLPVAGEESRYFVASANQSLLNLIFSKPARAAPSPKCDKKNSQTNPKAALDNKRLLVGSACARMASERRIKMRVGDVMQVIECSSVPLIFVILFLFHPFKLFFVAFVLSP